MNFRSRVSRLAGRPTPSPRPPEGSEFLPTSTLQRILVALWLLGIIVLRTSYLGEMKAALVVRTDLSSIRGIEDVARDDSITPIVLQSSGFYWLFRGKAVIIMMQTPVTASVKARCEQLGALDAEFYYAPNPISQIPMAMFMRKDIDPWFRNGVGEQGDLPDKDMFSVTTLRRILKGKAVIIMMQTPVTASVKARCEQLGALDAEFYYAPNPISQIPMAMFMRKDIDPWFRNGVGEQIELLLERGFIQKFYRDAKSDEEPCRAQSVQGQDRARSSSQLDTLQGVFLFWLLGIGFSGAFLCAECYCHRHLLARVAAQQVINRRDL
ncbi:uncharacterized protein ISCGN_032347 [Ixodes scapularis]